MAQKIFTPVNTYESSKKWAKEKVEQMTLEEKCKLIGGQRIFFTTAVERLGIPEVMFADATQGINLRTTFEEYTYELPIEESTAMPSPILLASTWNTQLAHDYAEAVGEECKAAGIPVLLGPGMNIYRISQCGRNFEYFGEDPFLVSRMIENYVIGMQNTGTIATLKHFVANNTDYHRRKSNSIVDERTLNEIYMPAFKAGIDAGALAVMTSYNLVHGEWAGQSEYVINELLRKHLGFKWLVMTDWWSVWDGEKVIKSGMDLEMPATEATANAKQLVEEGKVKVEDIDRMVISLLATLKAIEGFNRKPNHSLLKLFPKHEETALNAAREGVILLKNNGTLPLKPQENKILVTGPYADKRARGGGAARVKGYNNITLLKALQTEFASRIEHISEASDEEIANAETVILSIGTFDSEGWDRSFDLPEADEQLVQRVTELNSNTIVIVNSGSGINMSAWNDKAAAILYAWYPGQTGNQASAEIISGKVNPSGKLPITIEKDFKDSPGKDYIPDGEELYWDWDNEGEKNREPYDLEYTEGIFVGYRWYEHKKIKPLYAFGHGLSYTSFNTEIKGVVAKERNAHVTVEISNTGKQKGSEVIQLYVQDKESTFERPEKELKAFCKVELEPDKSEELVLSLCEKDFMYWNPELNNWHFEPGTFVLHIGNASDSILHTHELNIE